MRRVGASLSALAAFAVVTTAAGAQEAENPLAAIEGMYHPTLVAFYERAPLFVRAAMRESVAKACSSHQAAGGDPHKSGEPEESTAAWLCSGAPLVFFRGVSVGGNRDGPGLICSAEGVEHFKYLPPRLVGYGLKCVATDYYPEKPHHRIDPSKLN